MPTLCLICKGIAQQFSQWQDTLAGLSELLPREGFVDIPARTKPMLHEAEDLIHLILWHFGTPSFAFLEAAGFAVLFHMSWDIASCSWRFL